MQNFEILNQNFVIRLLLELNVPVYVPVGIKRTLVIKLPRMPLQSCLIATGRDDPRKGMYIDLTCVNEDFLQCDLLLVVDPTRTRCWALSVESISQNRTISLNNKSECELVSICTSSTPTDPVADKNKILEILRQHNLGLRAQEELNVQLSD